MCLFITCNVNESGQVKSIIVVTSAIFLIGSWVSWLIGCRQEGPLYQNSVNLWRAQRLLYIAYFTALHALGSWLIVNAICYLLGRLSWKNLRRTRCKLCLSRDALSKGLQNLIIAYCKIRTDLTYSELLVFNDQVWPRRFFFFFFFFLSYMQCVHMFMSSYVNSFFIHLGMVETKLG